MENISINKEAQSVMHPEFTDPGRLEKTAKMIGAFRLTDECKKCNEPFILLFDRNGNAVAADYVRGEKYDRFFDPKIDTRHKDTCVCKPSESAVVE